MGLAGEDDAWQHKRGWQKINPRDIATQCLSLCRPCCGAGIVCVCVRWSIKWSICCGRDHVGMYGQAGGDDA